MRIHVLAKTALTVIAAAMGVVALTSPQVVAADRPVPSVSAQADKHTKAIAAAQPNAVTAAATVCGSGYHLYSADMLPDASRKATLFVYVKGSNPASNDAPTCAILDNNTGSAKWMKLKLCSNYTADGCASDEGTFSQYSKPRLPRPRRLRHRHRADEDHLRFEHVHHQRRAGHDKLQLGASYEPCAPGAPCCSTAWSPGALTGGTAPAPPAPRAPSFPGPLRHAVSSAVVPVR